MSDFRVEKDSMGEVNVPARAVPIAGLARVYKSVSKSWPTLTARSPSRTSKNTR